MINPRRNKILEKVGILIDWHNACAMSEQSKSGIPLRRYIKNVLLKIQNEISEKLNHIDGTTNYSCIMRIYHGWHIERQPTEIRRDFEFIKKDKNLQLDLSRRIGRVLFFSDFEFGDIIYNDEQYGTMFNTSRSQGQKMVDTAIACDALSLHATGRVDRVIIVSDDDDFVPVMISCEAQGFKIQIVRRIGHDLTEICDYKSSCLTYWGTNQ